MIVQAKPYLRGAAKEKGQIRGQRLSAEYSAHGMCNKVNHPMAENKQPGHYA